VMANMGISFISSHTVGLELAAGKLVILDVVGLPIVRDWFVIHLLDKKLAPIPAAFRAFLLEHGARIIQNAVGDLAPRIQAGPSRIHATPSRAQSPRKDNGKKI